LDHHQIIIAERRCSPDAPPNLARQGRNGSRGQVQQHGSAIFALYS